MLHFMQNFFVIQCLCVVLCAQSHIYPPHILKNAHHKYTEHVAKHKFYCCFDQVINKFEAKDKNINKRRSSD